MAKNPDLYKKRYKTLKEHQAAVAARKALEGGKNKGPVANAAAYGETLKKPMAKTKPIPKPAKAKPAKAKPATTKPASNKAVEGGYTISAKNRVKRAKDGMPYQGVFPGTPEKKGNKKPSRKDFPAGRAGASKYAAALRTYNKKTEAPKTKPKRKYNRRGRAI